MPGRSSARSSSAPTSTRRWTRDALAGAPRRSRPRVPRRRDRASELAHRTLMGGLIPVTLIAAILHDPTLQLIALVAVIAALADLAVSVAAAIGRHEFDVNV